MVALLLQLVLLLLFTKPARAAWIQAEMSCLESGAPLVVSFDNEDRVPQPTDWLAIYALAGTIIDLEAMAALWVFTCDRKAPACTTAIDFDTLIWTGPEDQEDMWPLIPGVYVAVLSGGLSPPYTARAVSEPFRIVDAGESCVVFENNEQQQPEPEPVPVPQPAPQPQPEPEPQPSSPNSNNNNIFSSDELLVAIAEARIDIVALIETDARLSAKFLRLAFHDCVDVCDGCVDFKNPDNAGLGLPVSVLIPIVNKYEERGLSRPDIWALAAFVASEQAQPMSMIDNKPDVEFAFSWVGRQTCDQLRNNNCGANFFGEPTACNALRGPHRPLCHGDAGTDTILAWFATHYGFDAQQVVAIMGAHTIGTMRRETLGFTADDGWDMTNTRFDNGYYIELVGLPGDADEDLPDWQHVVVENSDLSDVPDRTQWSADVGTAVLGMLNADMAIAKQVPDGPVTCTFKAGVNQCRDADATIDHVRRYADDQDIFLLEYRDALEAMVDNGYRRTGSGDCPDGQVCRLAPTGRR